MMKRFLVIGIFSILGTGLFGQEVVTRNAQAQTGNNQNSQAVATDVVLPNNNGIDQAAQPSSQFQQQNRQALKQVPANQKINAQIQAQSQVSRMQMRQMRTAQKQQNRAIQAAQQQKQFQRRRGHK